MCTFGKILIIKGGMYLGAGAGYVILAPIFRFFVWMTWKIDIAEGLDASLRYQSFKIQLQHHYGKDFKWI